MAKLTFNSVVYLKSTLEKVYVRAIIIRGQSKKYKLSNGMISNIEDLLDELPAPAGEPLPAGEPVPDIITTTPKTKVKTQKDR
jgi:hypothetical protein